MECKALSSLPDFSNWNTNNVNNMSYMFNECKLLSSLPDISKWNLDKVTNINEIFNYAHHYHIYLIFQNGILVMLLI